MDEKAHFIIIKTQDILHISSTKIIILYNIGIQYQNVDEHLRKNS